MDNLIPDWNHMADASIPPRLKPGMRIQFMITHWNDKPGDGWTCTMRDHYNAFWYRRADQLSEGQK